MIVGKWKPTVLKIRFYSQQQQQQQLEFCAFYIQIIERKK